MRFDELSFEHLHQDMELEKHLINARRLLVHPKQRLHEHQVYTKYRAKPIYCRHNLCQQDLKPSSQFILFYFYHNKVKLQSLLSPTKLIRLRVHPPSHLVHQPLTNVLALVNKTQLVPAYFTLKAVYNRSQVLFQFMQHFGTKRQVLQID